MNRGCKHSLRISVRILSTILTLMLAAPGLFAQNNPPAARLRSLNNQLLGIYGRLLSSPAGEAIALALCGPPLQLGVRDCNEKIAFTTCQMSNACCAMFNVVVKTPDDLLTKPPNPQWETI